MKLNRLMFRRAFCGRKRSQIMRTIIIIEPWPNRTFTNFPKQLDLELFLFASKCSPWPDAPGMMILNGGSSSSSSNNPSPVYHNSPTSCGFPDGWANTDQSLMETVMVTAPPSDAEAERSDQRQVNKINVGLTPEKYHFIKCSKLQ